MDLHAVLCSTAPRFESQHHLQFGVPGSLTPFLITSSQGICDALESLIDHSFRLCVITNTYIHRPIGEPSPVLVPLRRILFLVFIFIFIYRSTGRMVAKFHH